MVILVKNKLGDIRLKMGFRFQKEFAEYLGLSSWLYNRYEKNVVQPGAETLLLICKKTNLKIQDVIYEVPTI
ncbi:MAG TPA: helix-turn-helix transcriptional regulator [Candidatus Paceibacterota bacterium]